MTHFTAEQIDALAAVHAAWPHRPIRLIGAAALGYHIPMDWRRTSDLDLTLAADFDELDASLARLPGWRREPRIEHRWWSPEGVKVDIVPAAPHHLAKGSITWPVSGYEMSVEGLELAFQHAVEARLSATTVVSIARLPALVVLKMAAWQDSEGRERERDLADIAHVFDRHLGPTDDRRYGEDVCESGLSYDHVGAFVMGREVAGIVQPKHRAKVMRFLDLVEDPSTPAFNDMLRLGPSAWRRDQDDPEEELASRLAAFRLGLGP